MPSDEEGRLTIHELAARARASGLRSPDESAAIVRADRDDPTRGEPSLDALEPLKSKAASSRHRPKG